jgi:hypothetical protein
VNTHYPDGSSSGIDKCGDKWTYNAATTLYVNENGERRVGIGAFRQQLEGPTAKCANTPKPASATREPQPPECRAEHSTHAVTGARTVTERCPDGTVKVRGETWHETYLPNGSAFGVDACGVD